MTDTASTEHEEPVEDDMGPDPRQRAREVYAEHIAAGKTDDDAQVAGLRVLATAAVNGDKRVIYDPLALERQRLRERAEQLGPEIR